MKFRKATMADVPTIYEIINKAQEYMKSAGIDQWQDGYPSKESIIDDINNDINYVYTEKEKVIGTIVVLFDGEKEYDKIYEGEWLTSGPYTAIHRVAVDESTKGQGIASKMISHVEELSHEKGNESIKVDTHKDNIAMQRMLTKKGFEYCGIVYSRGTLERIAFEKIL